MAQNLLRITASNRRTALAWIDRAIERVRETGKPWTMALRERSRTDEQNDGLHGLIDQILKQRPVHFGMRMTKESYKAVFMHSLGREPSMVPNLDGDGFFPMGLSTSKLTVGEFSQLMESIFAWCAREGLTVEHFDAARGTGAGEPLVKSQPVIALPAPERAA